MKEQVSISVIMAAYNVDKYVNKAIDSIIGQSFNNFEFLIINDGSNDNTGILCDSKAVADSRITVYHRNSAGVSQARNFGIEHANGEYIYFLDADDYAEPDMLENMYYLAESTSSQLVICGFYFENGNKSNIISIPTAFKNIVYTCRDELKKDFVKLWDMHLIYNLWNKLYVNNIIKSNNIHFPAMDFGEDMEFNKQYLLLIDRITVNDKCYYHYVREREGCATAVYRTNLFQIRLKEHKDLQLYFSEFGLLDEESSEFLSRRYIERVIGCVENLFHYDSKLSFFQRYRIIHNIVYDKTTLECNVRAKLNHSITKIMLKPIKLKLVFLTYCMGYSISFVRKRNPRIFTLLKQKRMKTNDYLQRSTLIRKF